MLKLFLFSGAAAAAAGTYILPVVAVFLMQTSDKSVMKHMQKA